MTLFSAAAILARMTGRYQIRCRTTYIYVGRINGSDNYEISDAFCS